MFYFMEPKHHNEYGAYLSFEHRALHEHLNRTAAQPIMAIMPVDRQLDIIVVLGTNHGTKGIHSSDVCIKRLDGGVAEYGLYDDLQFIAGREELTAYMMPRVDNWRSEPENLSALTGAIALLDAAQKLELEFDLDIDDELGQLWTVVPEAIRVHMIVSDVNAWDEKLTRLFEVVNDTELAGHLRDFVAGMLEESDDLMDLVSPKSVVLSYIQTTAGAGSQLSSQVELLQVLVERSKDLKKATE